MRFVNGDQRNRHTTGERAETFGFQTFRSHIQQSDPSRQRLREHQILFVGTLRGIDERGWNAHVVERVNLIAHQRDQRGNDDGHARKKRGGNLVADRLASTGGHDAERITALDNRIDYAFLTRTEGVISEVGA